jgi:hypothetical protein
MVGRFDIKEKSIDWTGSIGITEDNPDNIVVDTKQLEVKMRVEAFGRLTNLITLVTSR